MRKRGVGLYSWRQIRFETPYTYTVGIVVGLVMIALAVGVVMGIADNRAIEIKQYGAADNHWGGWITAVVFFLIGAFYSHAGVIYWLRRIFGR